MRTIKNFENVESLEFALREDAFLGDYNLFLYAFAYGEAEKLAQEHFRTLNSEGSYQRLLGCYIKSIEDYKERMKGI